MSTFRMRHWSKNLNALDTLANSLEVLNPVIKLIYDPTVRHFSPCLCDGKTTFCNTGLGLWS